MHVLCALKRGTTQVKHVHRKPHVEYVKELIIGIYTQKRKYTITRKNSLNIPKYNG